MRTRFSVIALVMILSFAGRAFAQVADPAPNPVLAYEGRLIESGTPVTGVRAFTFSILDSNGNELWNSGPQSLMVTEGIYGVILGATGMPVLPSSLVLKANLQLQVIADGVQLSPNIPLIPALQASVAWNVIGPFLGDVSGTQQTTSVDKLKGTPIDGSAPPTSGEVLTFNGTSWITGNGTSAMTASSTIPGTAITGNIAGNAANVSEWGHGSHNPYGLSIWQRH